MKLRRRWLGLLAVALIAAGIAALLLPQGNQIRYQRKAEKLLDEYYGNIEESMEEAEKILLLKRIRDYNQTLYESGQAELKDPFSYEQVDFSLMELGFKEELVGSLKIPKLGINLPVYLGANEANLEKGAAHLTYTSIPVGGENTNAVIAAHRNIAAANMLNKVDKLTLGDKVYIENFYETLAYKVIGIEIILPDDVDKILIQPGRDMLTLLTCHPKGQSTHRYIVYCERQKD